MPSPLSVTRTCVRHAEGKGRGMFLFFSNRLGCLGSILISVVLTLILLAVCGR